MGLCGGGHETFHFGEVGWLASEESYNRVRTALVGSAALPVEFRKIDLNAPRLDAVSPASNMHACMHVVYVSNADQSTKFLTGGRQGLERALQLQLEAEALRAETMQSPPAPEPPNADSRPRLLLVSTLEVSLVSRRIVPLTANCVSGRWPGHGPWPRATLPSKLLHPS